MREIDCDLPLPGTLDTVRIRCVTDRGRVVAFTVQYEAWVEGAHRPVVRIDSQHGRPDREILGWNGATVRKDWDRPGAKLPLGEAFTHAQDDVRANWRAYRAAFLQRKP